MLQEENKYNEHDVTYEFWGHRNSFEGPVNQVVFVRYRQRIAEEHGNKVYTPTSRTVQQVDASSNLDPDPQVPHIRIQTL